MTSTHVSKEAIWLQRLCSEIGFKQQVVRLECDSQSAIFLEKNPIYHSKMKHIDVQYYLVRLRYGGYKEGDPRSIKETIDSTKGELYKRVME